MNRVRERIEKNEIGDEIMEIMECYTFKTGLTLGDI